jgi:hypothetical protein
MNKMIKPALVIMVTLAVLAPSFGTETAAAKAAGTDPDITDVAKKVYPSVVRVEVQNGTRRVATGVVVEKGGYVVTRPHLAAREDHLTTSTGKTVEAEFLGFDTETQIALLKAKDASLPAIALGRAADLSPGSWIAVVGVSPERTAAVTQGIVSSAAEDKLRLNVWVTPGSSGGPIVDANGGGQATARHLWRKGRRLPVPRQEQAGSGYVMSSKAEAPRRAWPGRSGGSRQGTSWPRSGQGPGRARLAGRRHRPGRERADVHRLRRPGKPGRAGQAPSG